MHWIKDIQKAINFIENNLLEDISPDDVSRHLSSSTDHFQRTFHIVTSLSISEYIRNRRLTLAGEDVKNTQAKVIDIAAKYFYDSPDSFTKAFARFHGATPTGMKGATAVLNHFHPLTIDVLIKGGFGIRRKIIPNIPDIGYYGNETDYIINLFYATLSMTDKQTDRAEIAAYSTLGNLFAWTPGVWQWGNEGIQALDTYPRETEIRLLKNIGCTAKYMEVKRDEDGHFLNTDAEQIRRDFMESIDKGYPVITHGHGDGRHVITIGYEDNGRKIINKEARDGDEGTTPTGKIANEIIEVENWEDTITHYIVLKERFDPPPERERALGLFKHIAKRARSKATPGADIHIGFEGWEAYIHLIEHDDFTTLPLTEADITGEDTGQARCVQQRFGIYCDGLCKIWSYNDPLDYYRGLAQRFPEWQDELTKAADALEACANTAGFVWQQGFSFDEKGYEKFRDPAERKILADKARWAMARDMEAVGQFEAILEKEGMSI